MQPSKFDENDAFTLLLIIDFNVAIIFQRALFRKIFGAKSKDKQEHWLDAASDSYSVCIPNINLFLGDCY